MPNHESESPTAELSRLLKAHRASAVRIQEVFECALPVGSAVTVMDGNYPKETEIVRHLPHKRKAKAIVRDTVSGRMFETDITRMIVPGLAYENRSLEPAELPEPPVKITMASAEDHGIRVPANSPLTREQIEAYRQKAIHAEGAKRRPPATGRRPKYPFWALLPGDSFYTESVAPDKLRSAANQRRRNLGQHFAVHTEPPGVRVYRIR